ncbi:hypothetical protein BGW39_001362 [Mortierella sp. 14UC]|nr:hypothetical protein BGW39_001362 [Mortierella sp. 14UC]
MKFTTIAVTILAPIAAMTAFIAESSVTAEGTINIAAANADKDLFGKSDPYFEVWLDKDYKAHTKDNKGLNPVYDQTFCFYNKLYVRAADKDTFRDDKIGDTSISLDQVMASGSFNIALIASLALAASVAAQETPAAAAADSVAAVAAAPAQKPSNTFEQDQDDNEDEDDDQSALWGKEKHHHKHHKHHKHHHKHHKHHHSHHQKDRCCIKYVTITSVPECKPEPTKCPPKPLGAADAGTGIAAEVGAIMEAWNPPPPAPTW